MLRRYLLCILLFVIGVMPNNVPLKTLNDGNKMPVIALGTAGSKSDVERMRQAINWAIESGYRHIDTASLYQTEEQIGQGIADVIGKGLVKREDLFITTKLWNDRHAREQVPIALRESLQRLGLEYVDLYLIHFPVPQKRDGTYEDIDYLDTWRGMEDARKMGLTKSIGVSNFNSEQIDRIINNTEVTPTVNQIEVNPTLTQEPLVTFCRSRNITVMAYSPFGFMVPRRGKEPAPPPRIDDPILDAMAKKYKKTTTQIVLRYLVDRDLVPIPKSTNNERIAQNIDIFDFQLTAEEIADINKFNKNIRFINGNIWKDHPYFPFNKD